MDLGLGSPGSSLKLWLCCTMDCIGLSITGSNTGSWRCSYGPSTALSPASLTISAFFDTLGVFDGIVIDLVVFEQN